MNSFLKSVWTLAFKNLFQTSIYFFLFKNYVCCCVGRDCTSECNAQRRLKRVLGSMELELVIGDWELPHLCAGNKLCKNSHSIHPYLLDHLASRCAVLCSFDPSVSPSSLSPPCCSLSILETQKLSIDPSWLSFWNSSEEENPIWETFLNSLFD